MPRQQPIVFPTIAVGRLRVVTLGKEDRGYVATLVADKKDAKWMKKHLDAWIKT